jgi:pimeloyl-ACP methyl ester carboxylesterase
MTNTASRPWDIFTLSMDDGANIVIRRGGNPHGARLYLSNGNGFAIDGYRVFWEPLLETFDVVLFDMRNHGRNEPCGANGHHYKQLAIDIGTVFHGVDQRLGHRKSVGVFHSMSARAAMKHAVEMEWVWDALVLFDPPDVPPRGHEHYEAMRGFELRLVEWAVGRQDSFSSPEELCEIYATNRAQSRWTRQAREDMAKAILRPDGMGRYVLSCRRELEASIYLAALTLDLWPAAKAYAGPVKLIGCDPAAKGAPPTGAANRALALEGGYEYEAVPETGHLLQIERPEACREAMLSYLRKLALA